MAKTLESIEGVATFEPVFDEVCSERPAEFTVEE